MSKQHILCKIEHIFNVKTWIKKINKPTGNDDYKICLDTDIRCQNIIFFPSQISLE